MSSCMLFQVSVQKLRIRWMSSRKVCLHPMYRRNCLGIPWLTTDRYVVVGKTSYQPDLVLLPQIFHIHPHFASTPWSTRKRLHSSLWTCYYYRLLFLKINLSMIFNRWPGWWQCSLLRHTLCGREEKVGRVTDTSAAAVKTTTKTAAASESAWNRNRKIDCVPSSLVMLQGIVGPSTAIVTVLILAILYPPLIETCDCAPGSSANLCKSDFVGVIQVINDLSDWDTTVTNYEIKVMEVWLNRNTSIPSVAGTSLDPSACRVYLQEEGEYFVSGEKDHNNQLLLDLCHSQVSNMKYFDSETRESFEKTLRNCGQSEWATSKTAILTFTPSVHHYISHTHYTIKLRKTYKRGML